MEYHRNVFRVIVHVYVCCSDSPNAFGCKNVLLGFKYDGPPRGGQRPPAFITARRVQ